MNTIYLNYWNVEELKSSELINIEGGGADYEKGYALGQRIRTACDDALMLIGIYRWIFV